MDIEDSLCYQQLLTTSGLMVSSGCDNSLIQAERMLADRSFANQGSLEESFMKANDRIVVVEHLLS